MRQVPFFLLQRNYEVGELSHSRRTRPNLISPTLELSSCFIYSLIRCQLQRLAADTRNASGAVSKRVLSTGLPSERPPKLAIANHQPKRPT